MAQFHAFALGWRRSIVSTLLLLLLLLLLYTKDVHCMMIRTYLQRTNRKKIVTEIIDSVSLLGYLVFAPLFSPLSNTSERHDSSNCEKASWSDDDCENHWKHERMGNMKIPSIGNKRMICYRLVQQTKSYTMASNSMECSSKSCLIVGSHVNHCRLHHGRIDACHHSFQFLWAFAGIA